MMIQLGDSMKCHIHLHSLGQMNLWEARLEAGHSLAVVSCGTNPEEAMNNACEAFLHHYAPPIVALLENEEFLSRLNSKLFVDR